MTPHTIEVTRHVEIGHDEGGFYIHVEEPHEGYATAGLLRPDLEKLRAAIGELLEEEE